MNYRKCSMCPESLISGNVLRCGQVIDNTYNDGRYMACSKVKKDQCKFEEAEQ
jgi:hypothetical protein